MYLHLKYRIHECQWKLESHLIYVWNLWFSSVDENRSFSLIYTWNIGFINENRNFSPSYIWTMSLFEQLPTLGLDTLVVSVGDALAAFLPTHYVALSVRILTDFLLDRVALVILSFLLGAVFVLVSEAFVFWSYFNKAPILPPPKCPEVRTELPEVSVLLRVYSLFVNFNYCFLEQFFFLTVCPHYFLEQFFYLTLWKG